MTKMIIRGKRAVAASLCSAALVLFAAGALAQDQELAITPPQQPRVLILPAMQAGGIPRGQTLMISDRSVDIVKMDQLVMNARPDIRKVAIGCVPR